MLSTQTVAHIPSHRKKTSEYVSNDDTLRNLHIDRSFVMSIKENVEASLDNERPAIIPSISGDKLHRRNPDTVRQEIQSFDDIIPETTLADVKLNEMPGLQNTEQWKRIAARNSQASPPLSRHYYQPGAAIFGQQDEQIPQVLGSYRRPGRSENEQDTPAAAPPRWRTAHRRLLISLSIVVILIAILIAVVVAVIKNDPTVTDYYSGCILVQAPFDPALLLSSSTLTKNYQREFCSLISTTLIVAKTKYAIFYSTCTVNSFRNGSIIGDFVLGFTRYQNATRLNAFLSRILVSKQLFGGTILSIVFNSSTDIDTESNEYNVSYDDNDSNSISDTDVISSSVDSQEQNIAIDNSIEQQMHTTSDKGLSVTITITNNNDDYQFILIPIINNSIKSVVPNDETLISSSHLINIRLNNKYFISIDKSNIARTINYTDALSTLSNMTSFSTSATNTSPSSTLGNGSEGEHSSSLRTLRKIR